MAIRELEHEPANERRQAFIGDHVDHIEATPAGKLPLPLVRRMRDQASSRAG